MNPYQPPINEKELIMQLTPICWGLALMTLLLTVGLAIETLFFGG